MLKEELTFVKETFNKTHNVNNYRAEKREPLNKKEMKTLKEARKMLWAGQKALETTSDTINHK